MKTIFKWLCIIVITFGLIGCATEDGDREHNKPGADYYALIFTMRYARPVRMLISAPQVLFCRYHRWPTAWEIQNYIKPYNDNYTRFSDIRAGINTVRHSYRLVMEFNMTSNIANEGTPKFVHYRVFYKQSPAINECHDKSYDLKDVDIKIVPVEEVGQMVPEVQTAAIPVANTSAGPAPAASPEDDMYVKNKDAKTVAAGNPALLQNNAKTVAAAKIPTPLQIKAKPVTHVAVKQGSHYVKPVSHVAVHHTKPAAHASAVKHAPLQHALKKNIAHHQHAVNKHKNTA